MSLSSHFAKTRKLVAALLSTTVLMGAAPAMAENKKVERTKNPDEDKSSVQYIHEAIVPNEGRNVNHSPDSIFKLQEPVFSKNITFKTAFDYKESGGVHLDSLSLKFKYKPSDARGDLATLEIGKLDRQRGWWDDYQPGGRPLLSADEASYYKLSVPDLTGAKVSYSTYINTPGKYDDQITGSFVFAWSPPVLNGDWGKRGGDHGTLTHSGYPNAIGRLDYITDNLLIGKLSLGGEVAHLVQGEKNTSGETSVGAHARLDVPVTKPLSLIAAGEVAHIFNQNGEAGNSGDMASVLGGAQFQAGNVFTVHAIGSLSTASGGDTVAKAQAQRATADTTTEAFEVGAQFAVGNFRGFASFEYNNREGGQRPGPGLGWGAGGKLVW